MSAGILGLGEWVPERALGNDAWPEEFRVANRARAGAEMATVPRGERGDAIDERVRAHALAELDDPFLGTTRRRVVEPGMTAHEAEARAAKAALEDARVTGAEIDVVLSASAVPDRLTPPSAAFVANSVGAKHARALGVDAVCASAVAGLEVAAALVESGRARHVLMTQSHLMHRAFPKMHPVSPNVGDGATALVVGRVRSGGLRAVHVRTDGAYFDAVVWRRPKEADTPWWEPGGGMAMGSYDSERASEVIRDTVRIGVHTVTEAMDLAHVQPRDVQLFASVQPRRWVPSCMAASIGFEDVAIETFAERAHLGAVGVVTNLLEARRRGRLTRGVCVALFAQGAGLTRAAAILEWTAHD